MRTHTFSQTIKTGCIFLCIAAGICLCIISCSSFLLPPLEIIQVHTEPPVTVVFSQVPTKDSVERAFKITENGNTKTGNLIFKDERVLFYPDLPFRKDADYILTVTTAAETAAGVSLAQTYVKKFTLKPEHEAPHILSVNPADNQVIDDTCTSLLIQFSEPVDTVSCIKAVSFSPSFKWIYSFSSDKKNLTITFSEQLLRGKRYTMTVASSLQDMHGNTLINPYVSSFYYGDDTTAPEYTVSFRNISGTQTPFVPNTMNHNVPLNTQIVINCTEKIKTDTVQNLIGFTPPLQTAVKADNENGQTIYIDLKNKAQWNTAYRLRIKKGMSDLYGNILQEDGYFDFMCDNEKNRPVKIVKGFFEIFVHKTGTQRFLIIDEKTPYQSFLLKVEDFPVTQTGNERSAVLYYVVEVSADAQTIPLISAMENIRISSTNACVSIIPKNIGIYEKNDPAVQDIRALIDALPAGTIEGKTLIIKIDTEIRNKSNAGSVSFSIRELRDNLGNGLQKSWHVPLNKQ